MNDSPNLIQNDIDIINFPILNMGYLSYERYNHFAKEHQLVRGKYGIWTQSYHLLDQAFVVCFPIS